MNKSLPYTMGLFKKENIYDGINMNYYRIGNKEANCLADVIKFPNFKFLENMNLGHNRITNEGIK